MNAPRKLRRFSVHADGTVFGPSGRRLHPFPVKGYLRVNSYDSGAYKSESVHRLVCEAFHGPAPKDKPMARHVNGNALDNRAENLAWASQPENEADKAIHGTALRGTRHHQSKLTDDQVRAIRSSTESSTTLGPKFGVSPAQIRNVRARKSWRHLP